MRQILLSLLLLSAGCATKAPMVAPPAQANLYQKFYTERLPAPAARPAAAPRIYRGQDQATDFRHLLEDGYDLLGYSSFEAGDVAPEQALQQAAGINADVVLVYTKRSGLVPLSAQRSKTQPSEQNTKQNPDAPPEGRLIAPQSPYYDYFAAYWTKLPPPVLGLHVQDPGTSTMPGGLPVVAVIKDSPAATADMQAGDLLLRIGDTEMLNLESLLQAMHRYAGQSVEIVFAREAETLHRTVVLNTGSH